MNRTALLVAGGLGVLGVATMVLAASQGWGILYCVAAVLVVLALWRPARRASVRAALLVAVAAAVAVPAVQAWLLYDGDSRWAKETDDLHAEFRTGELLLDVSRPAVMRADDGSRVTLADPATGGPLADGHIDAVVPDVGVAVSDDERVLWYRWSGDRFGEPLVIPHPDRTRWQAETMTADTVVLAGCKDARCALRAFDTTGSPTWRLDDQVLPERLTSGDARVDGGSRTPTQRMPEAPVVVTGTGPLVVRDADTGKPLAEHDAKVAVRSGDLLVSARPSGDGCQLRATRGADEVWRTVAKPQECKPQLVGGYAAFLGTRDVTLVDLQSGDSTRVARADWDDSHIVGRTRVASEKDAVAGYDLRSGKELWRRESYAVDEVGAGSVLTRTERPQWNPFVGPDARDDGWNMHLLDAATGDVLARAFYPETIYSSLVVGDGFVVTADDVTTLFGR